MIERFHSDVTTVVIIGMNLKITGGLKVKRILYDQMFKDGHEVMFCDQCKFAMDFQTIHIQFGYGHALDGEHYDFCSDGCFVEWLKFNNVIEKD